METALIEVIEGEERKKYAKRHGVSSLINYYHFLPWKGKEAERIYKICNQKGITWEEYYGLTDKKDLMF